MATPEQDLAAYDKRECEDDALDSRIDILTDEFSVDLIEKGYFETEVAIEGKVQHEENDWISEICIDDKFKYLMKTLGRDSTDHQTANEVVDQIPECRAQWLLNCARKQAEHEREA